MPFMESALKLCVSPGSCIRQRSPVPLSCSTGPMELCYQSLPWLRLPERDLRKRNPNQSNDITSPGWLSFPGEPLWGWQFPSPALAACWAVHFPAQANCLPFPLYRSLQSAYSEGVVDGIMNLPSPQSGGWGWGIHIGSTSAICVYGGKY